MSMNYFSSRVISVSILLNQKSSMTYNEDFLFTKFYMERKKIKFNKKGKNYMTTFLNEEICPSIFY
jgi:hypothetical protein